MAAVGTGLSMHEVDSRPGDKSGQGLHNLRPRGQLLCGRFVWYTAPGEGTRVVLTIPRSSYPVVPVWLYSVRIWVPPLPV